MPRLALSAVAFALLLSSAVAVEPSPDERWTIFVANDNCPDYTWGFTETQTRQAFADVVRGHLDEMQRTDSQPAPNQDHYNAAVTQEVLCFLEQYPDRREELIRRVTAGRLFVSPYLCNSLWAFQSVEGALRTFYPARRLEREWGVRFTYAHHIELPSLPWGHATLLAGCGFRGLTLPFYNYDSTFGRLKNPPVFWHEGPDGSRVAVVLDAWASGRFSYTQGAAVLNKPDAIPRDWLPQYAKLGSQYPTRAILASGTHGDISPHSGQQARGFADRLIAYNARPDAPANLRNATVAKFLDEIANSERRQPWLPVVRGCFGHSWDLWPVSLAKYAADMREGERQMLAAESLLAVAAPQKPDLAAATQTERSRAEWCWAMLSDHAWNGTDERNQRHNAELRRQWAEQLQAAAESLQRQGWTAAGVAPHPTGIVVFNSLSFPRAELLRLPAPGAATQLFQGDQPLPSQVVVEDGQAALYTIAPQLGGFQFQRLRRPAVSAVAGRTDNRSLLATPTRLESPFYRLEVDMHTGGLVSLIHKSTGTELVAPSRGRSLGQTIYFDGREHTLTNVTSTVVAVGEVLARLRIDGQAEGVQATNYVTVYAALDRVDFDLRLHQPVATKERRLCHVFPLLGDNATLRVSTTGAVIRPRPQPDGDLLPGADTRRLVVQDFVSVATDQLSVTLVPLDSFALRLDLEPPANSPRGGTSGSGAIVFESVGNDQNYREMVKDQNGVTDFRARFSLRAQSSGYHAAEAFAFSGSVATPLLATVGESPHLPTARVELDPARAIATCLKPADDATAGGVMLRVREVAGRTGPLAIGVSGFQRAIGTDLLERDGMPLTINAGRATVELRGYGFAALRLIP